MVSLLNEIEQNKSFNLKLFFFIYLSKKSLETQIFFKQEYKAVWKKYCLRVLMFLFLY